MWHNELIDFKEYAAEQSFHEHIGPWKSSMRAGPRDLSFLYDDYGRE